MFCSRCGTEVLQQSQFCPTCGLDLRATTPVQAIATGDLTELDIVRESLNAEYEILEELGRGGMAIVYRARERQLEREVAIKVLPFSLAFDAEFVERFQREARTAAQLEHPNIIPIYRVGKTGRVIYFVMKLLRGDGLSRQLAAQRRLPVADIRRILIEAGNALGYAAKRGIVHRDIKPDNIMFDEFGQVVVTDFGIAKAASGQKLTGTGMSIGTPHYMSPEQARAQSLDGRSDIYSLGIVAYQCLIGDVPYDGEDSFSIGYKHIMEPIPSPALATLEERRLYEVVRRMISKDPKERFQDTDELVHALEGQPMTSPGAVTRATATRLGIATQPTAPLPSMGEEADEGLLVGQSGEGGPRRSSVSRRPAYQDQNTGMPGWILATLILAAAGGGGYYFMVLRPGQNARMATDSTATARDTAATPTQVVHADSAPHPEHHDSAPVAHTDTAHAAGQPAPPPPVGAADTGSLVLTGLPAGSSVLVDTRQVFEPVIRLAAGPHELAISAPNYEFFRDTVEVTPGVVLRLTPDLQPFGGQKKPPGGRRNGPPAPVACEVPSAANKFGRACYDRPPLPIGSTRVPLVAGIEGTPSPAVLLVKVSAEGHSLEVQGRTPSSDPLFERAAEQFALNLGWRPAMKGGVAVEGWTQLKLDPDLQ